MRLSVERDDPGYSRYAASSGASVTLDGVEVRNVLTADEEAGSVICVVTDVHGLVVSDPQKPGEVLKVTKHGSVVITLPDFLRKEIELERSTT